MDEREGFYGVPGVGKSAKVAVNCWLCKKPINGQVHYQGGSTAHPSHRKCLVSIKRSEKHGGGI